ncbi:MFS transporter [Marinifilum flexuosum]|uniref:ACS family hexuronate transporter-like MFS transporter n=1 Tax=Marinifilum flexuosum TaxID=1117708 RepID=A0A419WWH8_9BACT|nr:MFS transporter [Marinifilum flexuosum]RKD99807.1 ACS family hexuronate transporter-like MFS transporter [Marinifilum flexuosum]
MSGTGLEKPAGNYRYRILALLFAATTINYMDRSIMGVLGPTLMEKFHWSNADYGYINMAFKAAYAIGMVSMGGVIDRFGTKIGYTLSIAIWSIFGMLHAAVRPAFALVGFIGARFGLGIGEAGNFPAAVKTVAEWFPKKDRAFATGIFNAGSNVGAVLAPAIIPLVVASNGDNWQFAFLVTGAFSAIWVTLWLRTYKKPEEHPKVSKEELEYILQDNETKDVEKEAEKLSWSRVLPLRQTWAFAIGKITDAVWFFFMFWSGIFFKQKFGLDSIKELGGALVVIYLVADFGSIGGGYLSKFFINRGWNLNAARKVSLLICALCIAPVAFAALTSNVWIAVSLIALASGGHQAWSANLFTLVSDVMPKKAVASVVGIGGMVGAIAGMLVDFALGTGLDSSGNSFYFWMFLVAGLLYLVILGIIHLMLPKLKPLNEDLQLSE